MANFEGVALDTFSGFRDRGFDNPEFVSTIAAFEFTRAPIPLCWASF